MRTSHALSNSSAVSVNVLTVTTHAHNILHVQHNNVHQISCAGDHTSTVGEKLHPLNTRAMHAFNPSVRWPAFSTFYLTSCWINAFYMRNKRLTSNIISISQFRLYAALTWYILLVRGRYGWFSRCGRCTVNTYHMFLIPNMQSLSTRGYT